MRYRSFIAVFYALGFSLFLFGFGPSGHSSGFARKSFLLSPGQQFRLNSSYGKLPLAFEPNQGQTDSQVQYLSHGDGYTLFLTSQEAVLVLRQPRPDTFSKFSNLKKWKKRAKLSPFTASAGRAPSGVIHMKLEDTRTNASFQGLEPLPGVSNYFIGNDRSKWRTNIPQYAKVRAREIYPGVDMVYYGNQGHLEYDFVVKPGADPKSIHLKYEGAKSAAVNTQGDLELEMEGGRVTFRSPAVYQESGGQRNQVEGHYRMDEDGGIRFEVKDYDKTKPLVIDPQLDYSTYLGGNGVEDSLGIAVDGSGDAYITGYTDSGNFPTTAGSLIPNDPSAAAPAFVSELNPTGTALIYSTYLGGTVGFGGDGGNAIAVDGSGDAYVAGVALTTNFPTTAGAYQTVFSSSYESGFVTVLNPTGTGLVYSTFLGGSASLSPNAIAVDGSGNVYVAGWTESNFPTTAGAYQTVAPNTSQDGFVVKLNSGGTGLVYATFLGGNSTENLFGIAVDVNGDAFVIGSTDSTNFPTTPGAYQTNDPANNYSQAFVTELNPAGSGLIYSTFLGGNMGGPAMLSR